MGGVIRRGLAAGAVGTTVLNAVTYLDMAYRGRPPSGAPEQVVDALLDATGTAVPGRGAVRDNRRTAFGALSGIAAGIAVGVGTSVARAAGVRFPGAIAVAATGAAAMVVSDVPMAALGVSDPRGWSATDWVADAVPHLAYGLAVHAVLGTYPDPDGGTASAQEPPSAALVLRSALLGVAAGFRSSLGLAGPVLSTPHLGGRLGLLTGGPAGVLAVLAVAGEVVGDKLPGTPSRLDPPGLQLRLASGALGAIALARREEARVTLPLLAGLGGAAAGSYAGAAWRARASRGRPDWQGAVVEDAVALTLAALASLPGRHVD